MTATDPTSGNKSDKGFPHRFAVHTNTVRTYHFAADSEEEAVAWTTAITSWIGVDTEAVRAAQEAYRARLAQIASDAEEVKTQLADEDFYKPDLSGRIAAEDFLADKKGKFIVRPGRGETGLALSHHDKKHGVGHIVLWFHKEDGKLVYTETADATDSYDSVTDLLKGMGFPKACSCGWDVATHGAGDDLAARRSRATSQSVASKKKGKGKKAEPALSDEGSVSEGEAEEKPKKKKGGKKKKKEVEEEAEAEAEAEASAGDEGSEGGEEEAEAEKKPKKKKGGKKKKAAE